MHRPTLIILLSVFLAGCVPEGMRLPQSPLLAAFERKSGQIVFQGVDGNLYLTDQSASEPRALTNDAGAVEGEQNHSIAYLFPTWSPVDDRLAFARYAFDGETLLEAKILVVRADEDEPLTLYADSQEYPIFLYWSPDGTQISFLTSQAGAQRFVLRLVSAEGGEPRVVDAGRPVFWTWSPDGHSILAHLDGASADNPGLARLSLLSIGDEIDEWGLGLQPLAFQAPSFDPSGELALLAAEAQEGSSGLLLTNLEGEVQSQVAAVDNGAAFAWAPQGAYAAYILSDPETTVLLGDLKLVNLEDPAAPTSVSLGEEQVIAFSWSPDGERLAYFAPVFSAPEGEASSEPTASDLLLRLYVAEASSGTTRRIGTFRPTDAFLDILPFFDQYQHSIRLWSPDGNYLVFTALTEDGGPAVFVIPSSGTVEPRPVAQGTLAFWSWK